MRQQYIPTYEEDDVTPRKLEDICRDINKALAEMGIEPDEYGFDSSRERDTFPLRYVWIAVYYVTGGSEGWYVHIDVLDKGAKEGIRKSIATAKVWSRELAEQIVVAVSRLLMV